MRNAVLHSWSKKNYHTLHLQSIKRKLHASAGQTCKLHTHFCCGATVLHNEHAQQIKKKEARCILFFPSTRLNNLYYNLRSEPLVYFLMVMGNWTGGYTSCL